MIELRYIIRGGKVLQYRYRFPKPSDGVGLFPLDWEWSEWNDVKLNISEEN